MWERALSWSGPWQPVEYLSSVPKSVIRRHNRHVARGITDLIIPAQRYYYRFVYCV